MMEEQRTKAFGEYYFTSPDCPIAVREVQASKVPQHRHDLTDILHCHDFSELVIVVGGSGIQVVDGVEYPVAGGDVFLLQGFSEHCFRDRATVSLRNVQFDPGRLPLPYGLLRKIPGYNIIFQLEPTLRNRRNFRHRLHLDKSQLAMVEALVGRLRHELESETPGYEAAAMGILLELIVYISRHYASRPGGDQAAMLRLGELISRLESDFAKPWTLAQIARLAGMSPNNLLRLFKAATGESPIDYLIKLRLRYSTELLERPGLGITEIALRCGFHDSNYFSKKFRELYGVSPRTFRNRQG